jgi:acetyl esterase
MNICSKIAKLTSLQVISIDYSLLPFPKAIEDSYDIIKYINKNGVKDITLIGDSAGGNIAFVIYTLIRDNLDANLNHSFINICVKNLYLICPFLFIGPYIDDFNKTSILTVDFIKYFINAYLPSKNMLLDRRVCPIIAGIDKLPNTVLFVSNDDVLKNENLILKKLNKKINTYIFYDVPHVWILFKDDALFWKKIKDHFLY